MDMKALFLILMFILGACFGSFLCCQARRLEYKSEDKEKKKKKNSRKSKPQKLGKRSICLECGYQLKWYDNIPIFSWLFLKGKCKKCHKPIGYAEIIAEVLTGIAFLMIGTTLDLEWMSVRGTADFIITMILLIVVVFLAIYDGISGKLPVLWLWIAIAIGAIKVVIINIIVGMMDGFDPSLIYMPLAAVAILGGVYWILHLVAGGSLVGDGDWLLGVAIGLALMEPWLALITLFVANVLACLITLMIYYSDYLLSKKNEKRKRKYKTLRHLKIYFGPYMVVAFVIAYTFSELLFYPLGYFFM